jgi:hypothetical protein
MTPYCSCAEIKDRFGMEVASVPEWHNCEYIAKRNALIPEAWQKAMNLSKTENNEVNADKLTYLFSRFMDQAAKEARIV